MKVSTDLETRQSTRENLILELNMVLDKLKKNEFKGIIAITLELEGKDKLGNNVFETRCKILNVPFDKSIHQSLSIINALSQWGLSGMQRGMQKRVKKE